MALFSTFLLSTIDSFLLFHYRFSTLIRGAGSWNPAFLVWVILTQILMLILQLQLHFSANHIIWKFKTAHIILNIQISASGCCNAFKEVKLLLIVVIVKNT